MSEMKILVVDDDRDFAESLANLLELKGYTTKVAHNSSRALALAKTFEPNVAFIDIWLGRENGLDLVTDLKERHPGTDCIVITAYADLDSAIEAVRHHAYDFLRKPFNDFDLEKSIDRCFEKQRLELDLKESEARLLLLSDALPVGISYLDTDYRYQFANKTYGEWHDIDPEKIIGKTASEVLGADAVKVITPGIDRALAGQQVNYEARVPYKDAAPRDVQVISVPQYDKSGKIIGAYGMVIDITERKKADEDLLAAKDEAEHANSAKSKFLAAASHDLRQPIQALGLLITALLPRIHDEEDREIIQSMEHSVESLRTLLDALLDISKLDAGVLIPDIKEFPVTAMLQNIETGYAVQAQDKGLDFRMVGSSAVICSDPVLLHCVLQNLVSNAIRYTKTGRVLLGCRRNGAKLRIEVWDTGHGIPADQVENIFIEFHQLDIPYRDRSEGLGLGLAIVDRITRLLDHRIKVESALDKGSVFMVEVPLLTGDGISLSSAPEEAVMDNIAEAFVVVVED